MQGAQHADQALLEQQLVWEVSASPLRSPAPGCCTKVVKAVDRGPRLGQPFLALLAVQRIGLVGQQQRRSLGIGPIGAQRLPIVGSNSRSASTAFHQ